MFSTYLCHCRSLENVREVSIYFEFGEPLCFMRNNFAEKFDDFFIRAEYNRLLGSSKMPATFLQQRAVRTKQIS